MSIGKLALLHPRTNCIPPIETATCVKPGKQDWVAYYSLFAYR
jgi:hypothetical protein